MGAARVGDKGWKKRARELGCESDVTAYEEAKKRHMKVKVAAEHGAVDAFQLRSYREGQQKMRQDKAHQVAMLATHAWTPRSEDAAMAFGLDRKDRTGELGSLLKLPAVLQGSILSVVGCLIRGTPVLPRRCWGIWGA